MLLMGKSTISMASFNSFLYVYQRVMSYGPVWLEYLVHQQLKKKTHGDAKLI